MNPLPIMPGIEIQNPKALPVKRKKPLTDARDAAAVAAGLCTAHGCKSAPMLGYRKCRMHHEQKQRRDSLRYQAKPHGLLRAARRDALASGQCKRFKCSRQAVKFQKCIAHLSSYQLSLIAPRVLTRTGRKVKEFSMYAKGPEYATVQTHRQCIKTALSNPKNIGYANMPFFADWDPSQGGQYTHGAQWIIENIGQKPSKDHELHIVDRRLGFVPGNLAWVPRSEHKREEMVAKLLIENRQLKDRLAKYESS